MPKIGDRFDATITRVSLEQIGDKDAIRIFLRFGEDIGSTLIFLTPAAMGITRSRIKVCGFDCDNRSLGELAVNDAALTGNVVPCYVEEYNGKTQINIQTSKPVTAAALTKYDRMLREAKDRDAKGTAAPTNDGPKIDDDDIPF